MIVYAVETSCDETSLALVEHGGGGSPQVLGHWISSQVKEHGPYGGVVPEIAAREHLAVLPVLHNSLEKDFPAWREMVSGVASTVGPGLASSLMCGCSYAKAVATALGTPWVGVNHLEGHLVSPFLEAGAEPVFPHLALIVSGGHTLLVLARGFGDYSRVGSTRDDAAGEAFDKVAKMLGLGYPGGPLIERLARGGNADRFDFPVAMRNREGFDFSFSGLKTAALCEREKLGGDAGQDAPWAADFCASFQEAVVRSLLFKTIKAMESLGVDCLTLSGGVSCNGRLREVFSEECERRGWRLYLCPKGYSTDNAAMIGCVAGLYLKAGKHSSIELEIDPRLKLGGVSAG